MRIFSASHCLKTGARAWARVNAGHSAGCRPAFHPRGCPPRARRVPPGRRVFSAVFCALFFLLAAGSRAGNYTNFDVAVYIPVGVVQSFADSQKLADDWARIRRQLKVDKAYIEVQRDRRLADDSLLEAVKKFFLDHGVRVAGGMALSDGSLGGQFNSFCYTDAKDRAFIQSAAELAARHFDEVIQDDFFFVNTKSESDLAAKGKKSWTQFRLGPVDEAAQNLIVQPAKAVNPRVKMVIKFPNWYEHFPGLGYDLAREPQIFDGIYTGTETRDPVITDQHLQQYESYQILRYFENIRPGGNGGGWWILTASAISTAMPSSFGTRCLPRPMKSRCSNGRR
jgi:hypothetical protein